MERSRSEEHTSELQSRFDLVCRLLLEKKKYKDLHDILKKKKKNENKTIRINLILYCLLLFLYIFFFLFNSFFLLFFFFFFFFNDTATTEIYTLSLHDALPIYRAGDRWPRPGVLRRQRH